MSESLLRDLRYAVRGLRRSPGFAAVALVTLALGVGLTAAIFSALDAVLLRPLPWGEPDRTVMIWSRWNAFDKTWVASGELLDYRRRSRTLHTIAAWSDGQVNVTGGGAEPERVSFATATANIFDALVVRPIAGRTFSAEEDVPNGPLVAVISYELRQRRFGDEASAIGGSIELNGRAYEVIGVMPRGFCLPTDFASADRSQVWLPLGIDPKTADHGSHGLYAVGRLRPGATAAQASDDLRSITQALTSEGIYPKEMQFGAFAVTLTDEVVGDVRSAVVTVFAAVGFLLLIACANVANLLLVRAETRQREIAVRSALGAGRVRVARQLVAEGLVLAAAGTAMGIALAYALVRWLTWWAPAGIPRLAEATVDLRVLLFAAGLTVFTAALFSLAPAFRLLGSDLTTHLKDGAQNATAGSGRQRFRSVLVISEMALAVVLVVGAGLMLRSLAKLHQIDLGFDPSNVLTLRLATPTPSYDRPEKVVLFYQQLVGLINEEMGRRYWAGRDPIGGRFRIGGNPSRPWVTVVGIIGDVRHNGVTEAIKEKFYIPHTQWHVSLGSPIRSMSVVLKTAGDPMALASPARSDVRALDSNLPIAQMRPMTDIVASSLSAPRFTSVLFGVFAGLALLFAAVGVYGVLSYLVTLRTREIGIRVAIGAGPGDVVRLVLRRGLALSIGGIVIGLIVAVPLARLASTLLYEVKALDPVTFVVVPLALSSVAVVASYLPARRATGVDPVAALKSE